MRSVRFALRCKIVVVAAVVFASTSCKKTEDQTQTGVASWYGHPFDGRLTANGETYDMEKMTAAHRTLPFGTVLRVENLVNGKTTEVRINDRGPFVQDRIIDLSHAAAQAISMPGIANVRLNVISRPTTRGEELFAVQVGAFPKKAEAEKFRAKLDPRFGPSHLIFRDEQQAWSILVGLESTVESANALALQIDKVASPAFVVLADPSP